MIGKTASSATLAAFLIAAGAALADDRGDRNERRSYGHRQHEQGHSANQTDRRHDDERLPDRRQDEGGQSDRRYYEAHRNERCGCERAHERDRRDERGAGPDRRFHTGNRLPAEYRHRQYVVNDWRGHHLSPPPRGYHWVQTGADYVLVAVATGIILQLLLHG